MNLQDTKKAVRENTSAIVTAVLVFLLVLSYIILAIPANKLASDNYNKSTLEEFDLQFNNTLKDYANQIDIDDLKDSIVKKATTLCPRCNKNVKDTSLLPFLNGLKCDTNYILKYVKDNLIINSVQIDSITNPGSEIIITKRINLKFSPAILKKYKAGNCKILNELCCIKDTSRVDKEELKNRLSGAIAFKNWAIYSADTKKIILNQSIDKAELDSVRSSVSKSGALSFTFSDKRFYKQSVSIDGTSSNYVLVGAISQADFDAQSKRVNINSTFISAFVVILLLLSIPLLKPIISSKKEKLIQFDIVSTCCAIGILTIVLVSFSFSQYLSGAYQNISSANLKNMNDSVSVKLNAEFRPYYNAMNMVNLKLVSDPEQFAHYNIDDLKLDSLAGSFMGKLNKNNFQNFFTINSKGDLIKDISKDSIYSIRRNYSERDYYKVLREKRFSNMLTAVFSKYDNRFKFVFTRKNYITRRTPITTSGEKDTKNNSVKIDTVDFSLSGFAFSPVFMNDIKCTINSGYMLCNNIGRVILNSDSSKSLHEDIYANSQKNYDVAKMLHGMKDSIFEMDYDGEPCLFYAKRYTGKILATTRNEEGKDSVYNAILNDYPLYLLSYKKLDFTNNLKIYTIINGFILSLAYVIGVSLLVLLYSIFFYMGEISILSRFHLHWIFPDNSRRKEYILLQWINLGALGLFLILFIFDFEHILYLAFLSGINLAFFNFILLNQRVFLLEKKGTNETLEKRYSYLFLWIFSILVLGYILPYVLYKIHCPSFGLGLSLFSHFSILYLLRKDKAKNALPEEQVYSQKSTRPVYINYFLSVVAYHYILVPLLIIFTLFISEANIAKDLNNSYFKSELAGRESDAKKPQTILKTDGKIISILPVAPPSKKYLEDARFDNFKRNPFDYKLIDFIRISHFLIFMLIICLAITVIFIRKLIDYYSGRFFFYELSEAYRLQYFHADDSIKALTNFTLIVPPYSEKDLQNLEITEKLNSDIPEFKKQLEKDGGDSKVWLKGVPSDIVSNQVKVELIMMHHFEIYGDHYKAIWDELSDEEKFVMNDFAVDSFVNYKNRNILMRLMRKGYIIADPLTGRLRVMNYGFRNFVIHLQENDPESAEAIKAEETLTQGTYSKWKLPLMIIAVSGILMFMYLNKESFNNVLFVGGSVISAIGLIAKFLNLYKQQ